MTDQDDIRVGEWCFRPAMGKLIGQSEERKLEDRAARTLVILCRERGNVVSQAAILAEVWSGRSVSSNSVAIVIKDLRRALGDDAHRPTLITTIPKRGYSLAGAVGEDEARGVECPSVLDTTATAPFFRPDRRTLLVSAGAVGAALAATGMVRGRRVAPDVSLQLIVDPVVDDTGDATYEPLAHALSGLIIQKLAAVPDIRVVAATDRWSMVDDAPHTLRLRGALTLWNGLTSLALEASAVRSGDIRWAGMTTGAPDAMARQTLGELNRLIVKLAALRGDGL